MGLTIFGFGVLGFAGDSGIRRLDFFDAGGLNGHLLFCLQVGVMSNKSKTK